MFPPDSGSGDSGGGGSYEPRNLPVPVPLPSQVARNGNGETWIGRALRALFGWKPGSIRADLKDVLEAGLHGESGFSPEESAMLKNILGLRERRVDDVMVPRADIIAVQQDISLGELIAFMTARAAVSPEANAKRKKPLPANLDLKAVDLSLPLSSTKIVREILFVPPSMRLIDLLAKMQATRIHLALVIDEYGGTDGLISIEDVVEQIVGEIEDEHDEDKAPDIARQNDDSFVADARASLEEVIRVVGVDFNVGDAAEDVDTIGGYLMTKAGRVPVRGELFPGPDSFEIEVLDADPRRVKRLRIYRLKDRRARSRESKRRDADGV